MGPTFFKCFLLHAIVAQLLPNTAIIAIYRSVLHAKIAATIAHETTALHTDTQPVDPKPNRYNGQLKLVVGKYRQFVKLKLVVNV